MALDLSNVSKIDGIAEAERDVQLRRTAIEIARALRLYSCPEKRRIEGLVKDMLGIAPSPYEPPRWYR